jgi:hypothetical protein
VKFGVGAIIRQTVKIILKENGFYPDAMRAKCPWNEFHGYRRLKAALAEMVIGNLKRQSALGTRRDAVTEYFNYE